MTAGVQNSVSPSPAAASCGFNTWENNGRLSITPTEEQKLKSTDDTILIVLSAVIIVIFFALYESTLTALFFSKIFQSRLTMIL